jgi:hypothetical protein
MQIALDIDDTITRCPEFFAFLSKAMLAAGHKVYIISYREDREFSEEDLAGHGIVFDELILPTEQEMQRRNAENWRQEASRWKAEVCRRFGIDVLFDDMPEVVNALGKDTVAFMTVDPSLGKVGYSR